MGVGIDEVARVDARAGDDPFVRGVDAARGQFAASSWFVTRRGGSVLPVPAMREKRGRI